MNTTPDLSKEFNPQPKVFKAKKEAKPIKQIGKKGKININATKELKDYFFKHGITTCEIQLAGCWKIIMGFAHGKKRNDLTPEELRKFAIGACNPCHQKIEYDCVKHTGLTMEQFVGKTIENRRLQS